MGQSNSYFDTDLSTVEKVSGTTNSVFIKEWVKAVKDANIPKKEAVYKDGIRIGTLEEILNKNPERCITIPMIPMGRSLNLSNSAVVILYEAYRQLGFNF